jgi:hypothetical protein
MMLKIALSRLSWSRLHHGVCAYSIDLRQVQPKLRVSFVRDTKISIALTQ